MDAPGGLVADRLLADGLTDGCPLAELPAEEDAQPILSTPQVSDGEAGGVLLGATLLLAGALELATVELGAVLLSVGVGVSLGVWMIVGVGLLGRPICWVVASG